eukprot:381228_1
MSYGLNSMSRRLNNDTNYTGEFDNPQLQMNRSDHRYKDNDFIPLNCSISPEEMLDRKHWAVDHFKEIVNHPTNRRQLLLNPSNWSIIIDSMYQSGSLTKGEYRLKLLEKILLTTKNTLRVDSDSFRIAKHADVNSMSSKHAGFREYIHALGFQDGIMDGRLVMIESDQHVINTAITAIQNKIKLYQFYENLCTDWQCTMGLMLKHPSYAPSTKNSNRTVLIKCIAMDFVLRYSEYHDLLSKLQSISSMKIYSDDGLILQMMTNIGFEVSQMGTDEASKLIFTGMEKVYNIIKQIETFKQSIQLTSYYKSKNASSLVHESQESKYDDDDSANDDDDQYQITVQHLDKRKDTGIAHFTDILNTKDRDEKCFALLNPVNWNILIDAICLNMTDKDDKIRRLKKLKKMAQKACHDEDRRVINLDLEGAKKNITSVYGAMELLKGAGFEIDAQYPNLLVFKEENLREQTIDVMVNALMHKVEVLGHMKLLQNTWRTMTQLLCQHPVFADENEVTTRLVCMDLYNNYKEYYEILRKVKQVKTGAEKTIPVDFLKHLGLELGHALQIDVNATKMLLYNLKGTYDKINEIEGTKQRYKYAINKMVPSLQRLVTSVKSFESETAGYDKDQTILDKILQFAKKWDDGRDDNQQMITDEDLARLYEAEDMHDLENEMLTKVYELQHEQSAMSFQMNEFLTFIHDFRQNKHDPANANAKACQDIIGCKWTKDLELWNLSQRCIIHVMFYHTKDYMDIASSEMRAARFRHDVEHVTPGNAINDANRDLSPTKTRTTHSTPGYEAKSSEPGICSYGKQCKQLGILLNNCSDVNGFNSSMKDDGDQLKDVIDHCLEFHGDFRTKCIFKPHCSFQSKLSESNSHRLVQLHGHFYHDFAIDADESEGPNASIDTSVNEEKIEHIQYKGGNKSGGILEFGSPFVIKHKNNAKFKNPKEEMLKNTYHHLSKQDWNGLLKKCVTIVKSRDGRRSRMNMKEIVSLKLYTDYDLLQREFRKCFRGDDLKAREQRQREFYFWNNLLQMVCKKSTDAIAVMLYHGVSDKSLSAACFSGTYYGPVSTTIDLKVARGFAGEKGQILELYPSFGAKGLNVSWLSNFPDENEVLYMNVSFQISNIVKISDSLQIGVDFALDKNLAGNMTSQNMEYCILRALQTINIDSQIISLNDMDDGDETQSDLSNFKRLKNYEKLSVLYLLYLQYRPKEWDELISQSNFVSNAFMRFREQFISLAQNVTAVSMDKMGKLLQIFFYTKSSDYHLPILNDKQHDLTAIYHDLEKRYKPNQPFYFSIIVKLFPCAQQIALNAANFDWSLRRFIDFLRVYDFDFHKIALQDIYIRGIDDAAAGGKLQLHNARDNLYRLKKLGWAFLSSTHLHRVQLEPLPALPFLMTFGDYDEEQNMAPARIFRSHSQFIMLNGSHMTAGADSDEDEEGDMKEDVQYILIDHDPKSCVLSRQIFKTLDYKKKLSELLLWKKLNWKMHVDYNFSAGPGIDNTTERTQYRFANECHKVESLVLDPLPRELYKIFYDGDKHVISFENAVKVFPNLTDLFLRHTTFKLRECYKFVKFVRNTSVAIKLERVFFSKTDVIREKDVSKVKLRLREIGWDFINTQQMICRVPLKNQKK